MDGTIVFLLIVVVVALIVGLKLGHNKGKTGSFTGGGSRTPTHLK